MTSVGGAGAGAYERSVTVMPGYLGAIRSYHEAETLWHHSFIVANVLVVKDERTVFTKE